MKKILIILMGIFLITIISQLGFVSADGNLGTFKQADCIELYQYCNNCTYVNVTNIQYPDGVTETTNLAMTKEDIDYNYTFCNTTKLGTHYYTVKGDKDGVVNTERMSFEITTTGRVAEVKIAIFMLLISLVAFIFALYSTNYAIGFISGVLFLMTGIYLIVYGFGDVANMYTQAMAYIVIAFGLFIMLIAGWEWIESME